MSNLSTGKRYELQGSCDVVRTYWPAVKGNDPKAVLISVPSEDVSSIGTDDIEALLLGNLDAQDPVKAVDTHTGQPLNTVTTIGERRSSSTPMPDRMDLWIEAGRE